MYRHLLVTVDGAPGGIDAIGHALELARAVGARVTFVLPGAAPDSRLSGARLPEQGAKVEAAARAQGLSHVIAGAGHPGAGDIAPGALAAELGCDLIGVVVVVSLVAEAVRVEVVAVRLGGGRPARARAVVAAVFVPVQAGRRVERGDVLRVLDPIVVVVPVSRVTEAVGVRVQAV